MRPTEQRQYVETRRTQRLRAKNEWDRRTHSESQQGKAPKQTRGTNMTRERWREEADKEKPVTEKEKQ